MKEALNVYLICFIHECLFQIWLCKWSEQNSEFVNIGMYLIEPK